jgi:hypothetical protein
MDEATTQALFTDYTSHAHTGTTTEDTIYTKTIRGGLIGANGALTVWMHLQIPTQGAAASTLRLKLGGTTFATQSIPAGAGDKIVLWYIANRNAQNVQTSQRVLFDAGGTFVMVAGVAGAEDTSVDTNLVVTWQNGTNTDNQTFNAIRATLENSFGPV